MEIISAAGTLSAAILDGKTFHDQRGSGVISNDGYTSFAVCAINYCEVCHRIGSGPIAGGKTALNCEIFIH